MRSLILILLVIALSAVSADAASYNIDNDPGHVLYGNLDQNGAAMVTALGQDLANQYCGPVAVTNSFRYLENKYPTVYGNNLTSGNLVGTAMGLGDLMGTDFINGTWWDDLIWYKMIDLESKVPGMTDYQAQHMPGWNWNIWDNPAAAKPAWVESTVPTWQFLWEKLVNCEDIEILMNWSGGGHFVTVKSFHWNDADNDNIIDIAENATFDYINPWTGASGVSSIWQDSLGNPLETNYASGAYISMMVSETPVPEPAAITLLGLGALGLIRRRKSP